MNNDPSIMNNIKRIFNCDKWDGRVKVILKSSEFRTEDLVGPFYRTNFLNFSYIDTVYKHRFLESGYFDSNSATNNFEFNNPLYALHNYDEQMEIYNSFYHENEFFELIKRGFEIFCKLVFDNDNFKLFRFDETVSLKEAIESEGNGCLTLFYIYVNLLINKVNKNNLVINNVELSLHPTSLKRLKYYIEKEFNYKIIFLTNRYDLIEYSSGEENLYLFSGNKIDLIGNYFTDLNELKWDVQ